MSPSSYILHPIIDGEDRLAAFLSDNRVSFGWSQARDLLDPALGWTEFGESVRRQCAADGQNPQLAAEAATQLWRFLRQIKAGDWLVVPYGLHFYLAEVVGAAEHWPQDGSAAWSRPVRWLNDGLPAMRGSARSALVSRMRNPGPCVDASDLIDDVRECVSIAEGRLSGIAQQEAHKEMVAEMLAELRSESTDRYGFERLVQTLLLGLGAAECQLHDPPLPGETGLMAMFRLGSSATQIVPINTGHWQSSAQLDDAAIAGFESALQSQGGRHGLIATCGTIAEPARLRARQLAGERGLRIDVLDGAELAQLVVEHGIRGGF